jgi:hypothetical protein
MTDGWRDSTHERTDSHVLVAILSRCGSPIVIDNELWRLGASGNIWVGAPMLVPQLPNDQE